VETNKDQPLSLNAWTSGLLDFSASGFQSERASLVFAGLVISKSPKAQKPKSPKAQKPKSPKAQKPKSLDVLFKEK
jgi:hypothetical protein